MGLCLPTAASAGGLAVGQGGACAVGCAAELD
jgi:hypothetical protein